MLKTRRGQAEHIFSDVLPGIALILLGVFIIQIVHADVYEGLDRRIHEQTAHALAERQLTELLETPLLFENQRLPFWRILLEGRYALEHPVKDSWSSLFFYDSYAVIESYPPDVFSRLYQKDDWTLWYLLLRYDGIDDAWMGNAESLQDSCSKAYEAYSLDVVTYHLPDTDGHSVDVELHYCTLP